jgi:hypothetical protein
LQPRVSPVRAVIALAAAVALAIAGCNSPVKPKPASTSQASNFLAREHQLVVALVGCFYRHHLIPQAAVNATPGLPVHNGAVATSTSADQGAIVSWFASVGQTLPVEGVSMGSWLGDSDTDPSAWPTSLCGPIPSSG